MARLVYDPMTQKIKVLESSQPIQLLESYSQTPTIAMYLVDIDLSVKPSRVKFFRIIGRKPDSTLVATSDKRLLSEINAEFFSEFNILFKQSGVYAQLTENSVSSIQEVEKDSNLSTVSDREETNEPSVVALEPVKDVERKTYVEPKTQGLDTKTQPVTKNGGFFGRLFGKKPKVVSKILFYGEPQDIEAARERIEDAVPGAEDIEMLEFVTLKSLNEAINANSNYLLIADKVKLSSSQNGADLINILENGGVSVIEIKSIASMSEPDLVSLIQNVKDISIQHVLYNKQRVILFVNATGGVGKTTLSINLSHWLASKAANVMYMEVLGGSGIDNLIKTKSVRIEDVFDGSNEPRPIAYESGKIAYLSLEDSSKGSVSQSANWKSLWNRFIDFTKSPPVQYHAVTIDTYTHMISTRYLLAYATDVIVVADMRETTENMTKNTVEELMKMLGEKTDKKFYLVINTYQESEENEERYQKIKAETTAIADNYDMTLKYIRVPWMPDYYQSIVINDEKARSMFIQDIVKEIYGVKV